MKRDYRYNGTMLHIVRIRQSQEQPLSPFFQQQEAQLKAFFNHLTNIDPKQFHLHGFERPHVCNAWIPALLSADRADLDAWVSAHIPHTWFHNFPNGLDLPTITGLHGIARVRQFLAMNQFTGIAFYRPTEWEARELAAYFCDAYDGGRLFDLLCAYWYRHFVTNPDALLKDVTAHSISAVDLIQGKEPTFPSIHPSLGRCFLTGRLTRNILCNQLPWLQPPFEEKKTGAPHLLSVNLDLFKWVNDIFSLLTGDKVLITVANTLYELGGDQVYRTSGDEFAVLYAGEDVTVFAEEIRRRIKLLYPQAKDVPDPAAEWARDFPGVSCTIGVSSHPMMNEALRQTDEAMIFGKQHGRNRVVFWEEAYRPPD